MVTVQVPEDLHVALKKISDKRGMKVRFVVEQLLRYAIQRERELGKAIA